MSTEHRFSQEQLVALMIQAMGIHEGHFVLVFDVDVAMGGFTAPAHPTVARTGMMITFDNFAIQEVESETLNAVDASKVNPA